MERLDQLEAKVDHTTNLVRNRLSISSETISQKFSPTRIRVKEMSGPVKKWWEGLNQSFNEELQKGEEGRKRLEESWKKLVEEKEILQREREAFEKEKEEVADLNVHMEDLVTLSIGGQEFSSFRRTFCSIKGSKLERLLNGDFKVETDSKGRYFFDRGTKIPPFPSHPEEQKMLVEEFQFYGIPFPGSAAPAKEHDGQIVA